MKFIEFLNEDKMLKFPLKKFEDAMINPTPGILKPPSGYKFKRVISFEWGTWTIEMAYGRSTEIWKVENKNYNDEYKVWRDENKAERVLFFFK